MAIARNISVHWLKLAAAVLALPGISCTALPSVATRYRPPQNLQRPEGRQGGATRSGCLSENFTFEPILPTSNYGLTTADYPTIYWHLSNHKFTWAKFELYPTPSPAPDAVPQYSKTVQLTGENPLHSFTLPSNEGLKPLEVGQEYLWKVTLICSKLGPDDESADGSQRTIQGSIIRAAVPATLQDKLIKTKQLTKQLYDVYAEEGFWYDAIQDIAVKRQNQPQTPQLDRDWCDLLKETRLNNQCCK
jgi:Domain of Unknown Function (DUF928)